MLFVQSAKGASLDGGKLTLKGVSPTTVYFSDRPNRIAGHLATTEMIPLWSEGKDSFTKDPPNATLSAFAKDGAVANVVVELRNPKLTGDQLVYDVKVLEGRAPRRHRRCVAVHRCHRYAAHPAFVRGRRSACAPGRRFWLLKPPINGTRLAPRSAGA